MDDDAYIEVGYFYTFMLSAIFLSTLFYSVSGITGDKRAEFAKEEFQDISDRVANSIEEASYLALKTPNASFEKSIVLSKYTRDYKFKIIVTNNSVTINSTDGEIHVESIIKSSTPCAGTVSGDSETVKIIYQKNSKAIKVS